MSVDSPSKALFFCTTRIETLSSDRKLSATGTGFIFDYEVNPSHHALFIVTCRHVVSGFATATISFVRDNAGQPELGQKCIATLANLQGFVFYDPDPSIDIAIIPFVPILQQLKSSGQTPFFRTLGKELIPNEQASDNLSAIQSIVFVGYPSGLRDDLNLLPIARRGFTASPYSVDFNGLPLFLMMPVFFPAQAVALSWFWMKGHSRQSEALKWVAEDTFLASLRLPILGKRKARFSLGQIQFNSCLSTNTSSF